MQHLRLTQIVLQQVVYTARHKRMITVVILKAILEFFLFHVESLVVEVTWSSEASEVVYLGVMAHAILHSRSW